MIWRLRAKKTLRLAFLGCVGMFLLYFLFGPRPHYKYGHWGRIFDWEKHSYSFCTHKLPENYKFASYENNDEYTNEALFFENRTDSRYLILIKFEEIPSVNLETVRVEPDIPRRSVDYEYQEFHNIKLWYYLLWRGIPGMLITDLERLGDQLLLRGLRMSGAGDLSTGAAKIRYFVGQFERLGFYRQWGKFGGYPVPVLDSLRPRYGGVAVIRSRESPETIFAILEAPDKARFDENEFRQILESITFEKQSPGTKEWIQSFKRSGQTYEKETTQWGPFKWEREKVGK